MIHISLFSGIGGFDLAAQWAGWENVVSCEISDFNRRVLEYYWPKAYHHDDIHTLNENKINEELKNRFGENWRESNIIVLSGGFPCQPYSTAGKRLGKDDARHLWPEMLRVIRIIRPNYIVGENVLGIVNWNEGLVFEEVCVDLETEGYQVQPYVLPACGVDAPHRRDRVWFVASLAFNSNNKGGSTILRQIQGTDEKISERYDNAEFSNADFDTVIANTNSSTARTSRPSASAKADWGKINLQQSKWRIASELNNRLYGVPWNASNSNNERLQRSEEQGSPRGIRQESHKQSARCVRATWENFPTQPPVCGGDDGVSYKLDGITFSKWRSESLKAYGNAIVPQVAYQIFKAINDDCIHSNG